MDDILELDLEDFSWAYISPPHTPIADMIHEVELETPQRGGDEISPQNPIARSDTVPGEMSPAEGDLFSAIIDEQAPSMGTLPQLDANLERYELPQDGNNSAKLDVSSIPRKPEDIIPQGSASARSINDRTYDLMTVEGRLFTITHAQMQAINFKHIRASKRRRFNVFLGNGRSVRLKIRKNKLIWQGYQEH